MKMIGPKELTDRGFMKRFARGLWCATPVFGLFAFWAGMVTAARHYPSEYDWRYMTMSSLVFPDRNPGGHLWASAGIALFGLCGLCWAAALARRNQDSAGERPIGIWGLRLAGFCMACCAVLPERLLRIPKGHEILALTAFLSVCLAIMHLTFQAVERHILRRPRGSASSVRLYAGLLAGTALSPILLAGLAQTYVAYALPELPWVSLSWRARDVPVYLSFAFWEWTTCVIFSAYVAILSVLMLYHRAGADAAGASPRIEC
jgi:hypothetical protein